MKRLLAYCLSVILISSQVQAQFKELAHGISFEEPQEGVARIVQMKNGNTFYVHVTEKDGADLRVYGPDHSEKVTSAINPAFGRLRAGAVENVFEVKGDIALFVSEFVDRAPILYRLIFDGNTGKLKEEKTLASMKGYKGVGFLNTDVIDAFRVRKSVTDDSYAVRVCNYFEDDKDKRNEIVQYDDNNNEVNRTFLVTPDDDEFKWYVYMTMEVLDANRVNVIMYNGKEKYFNNTKKGRLVMASIDRTASKPVYTNVPLPEEKMKFSRATLKYVSSSKMLYLLWLEENEKDRDNYNHYMVKIDPADNKMTSSLITDVDEKLNQRYKDRFSVRKDYVAMYKNFWVKPDGSYTVMYEERYSYTTQGFKGATTSYYTGKIMVMDYTSKGEVVSGYIVPKSFSDNLYSQYKEALYIDNGKAKYVAINDTERNNDFKKDKLVTIEGVSECDAFLYKLEGDDIVPSRTMIYGSNSNGHNLSPFRVSDYNSSTNTLVTLKLNKKSPSDKSVCLIWLQPQ